MFFFLKTLNREKVLTLAKNCSIFAPKMLTLAANHPKLSRKANTVKTGSRTKNLRSTPDIPEGSHGSPDSSKLSGVLLG